MSKLNKILLTSDLELGVSTPTLGETGRVLVRQNSVGFHTVTLPEGHFGNITVEPTPNKTTLLEYYVDDSGIYWNSTILTPADDISSPSAIIDLKWNYLDATTVQIQFTAPSGNQTLNADKYIIYYSNAPFDNTVQLNSLGVFKNSYVPKAAGQLESFNLTKLTPKQIYYVAVVATKTTYGKTREGALSNVIQFTTLPLEGGGSSGDVDILIPVKSENVTTYSTLFKVDTDGIILDEKWLVDYSSITLQNGLPVGVSARPMVMVHTNQFKDDYYNQEQTFIFDLEDAYQVNTVFLNPAVGSDWKNVYTSSDGTNYNYAGQYTGEEPKNEWTGLDLDPGFSTDVRFIKITVAPNERSSWYGVVFKGKRLSAQNLKGVKYKNTSPSLTLPERIGTNSNIVNDVPFTATVAKTVRLYSNPVWYNDETPMYQQGGGADVTLENIQYKFAKSNVGDSDVYFKSVKDNGMDIIFCVVSSPYFLSNDDVPPDAVRERKPLDWGYPMTLEYTTNPLNYKFIAQFYWQVAARYGSKSNQPNSLFRIHPSDTIKKGLGYVKYYELGINECSAASTSTERYTNPEELAAIISACYDGHKGAMGAGFGIKDADPDAVAVMVGLTSVPIGYKMAMLRWWDVNRGVGDYPIHFINEHFYNVTGGAINYDNAYARYDLYGEPPERGDFIKYANTHVDFRNRYPSAQHLKFMISEIGYDEHKGSIIAPNDVDYVRRGWKKALWTLRTFLIADYLGIDTLLQYAIFGLNWLSDFPPNIANPWVTFATSGYLDGPNGAANRPPTQAYYYATAFQKAMAGYKFSHAVRLSGAAMTNEVVSKTTDPDLWVLAYKPVDNSRKPMLVMWLGNDSVTQSVNIDFKVGGSESSIDWISFDDLHNSHLEIGTNGNTSTVLDGSARKLTTAVTATPKIIFTYNIGTAKLTDPMDVIIQALTPSQIKLVWSDKNLGLNNTRVYRSNNPSTGFTEIYNGYIDNGTYTDNGLNEYTTYYYRLQFEKDNVLSNTTTSYGVQTLKVIAVPGAFNSSSKSPSSITVTWTYGQVDADYIDGFELWRSNASAGVYTKVATIANTATSYKDDGLVANTSYYYKLRAFKGLSYGNYTATLNTTTDPISLVPPTLQSAQTGYSGDRLTLQFSLPIDDPSGLESYFTVIEAPGTLNRYISAISVGLNPTDNTKVNVYLSASVTNSSNAIRFSYDGVNGTLQSIYGVKVNSISNQTITNRLNDASLLSKRIKINMTNDANISSAPNDWNHYNLTGRSYNNSQLVIPTKTDSGAITAYKFVMVESNPTSHLQNIIDVSSNPASYFTTGDPVNGQFPIEVRTVTAVMGSDAQAYLTFALMKLDTTKIYNIKLYSWLYDGVDGTMLVRANGTGTGKFINGGGNVSQILTLNNVSPTLISLPAVSGDAANDGYTSPMISINCQNTSGDRSGVTSMIIEEVINN
ncbi:fibronectin type III domain-containing protein [Mucilaginibacter achroorhodeus]|uniref:Fibronectin type III domain-containing protein n=1 Tax=Mucilaginibacter achroorhodeus TaxID=2599294 RepID=A0A563U6C8_9SPHI|nr:fibronectin type III domain-containing protein [Mucilaginibacter achroorhodeus]TWR26907.1 fibronectin type III domain-containing protein [Mucilaginibacter achroorhodeus]